MEINKEIKLQGVAKKETIAGSKVFGWKFQDYEFEYVDGDSRFDVKYPNGKWVSKKVYAELNKAGAIKTIKQFLTLEMMG